MFLLDCKTYMKFCQNDVRCYGISIGEDTDHCVQQIYDNVSCNRLCTAQFRGEQQRCFFICPEGRGNN